MTTVTWRGKQFLILAGEEPGEAGWASIAYEFAYHLSGGREFHDDADSTAVHNLLLCTTNSIVAFALHHLRPLLPDLTDERGPGSTQP
ncbi:hypothetical protein [Streptomyces eurythermus]|uniref:hypothetical protein n=1 Tax=Streptomyces eurythermus TaxID=42237 RepID=UPI0036F5D0AB